MVTSENSKEHTQLPSTVCSSTNTHSQNIKTISKVSSTTLCSSNLNDHQSDDFKQPARPESETKQIEHLLAKYYDPNSEKYVFKEYNCEEMKLRNSGNKNVEFDKSVGGKKIKFLNEFFCEEDDSLNIDLDDKSIKFMEEMLGRLADMSICSHVNRAHRARFMCHTCYHKLGNIVKAWNCAHIDRPHHSNGTCKACYHKKYFKEKTQIIDRNKSALRKSTKSKVI